MRRHDDTRSLLRSLYATEADILADHNEKKVTVPLHQPASRGGSVTIMYLIEELNSTRTTFPGTNLRRFYELVA